MNLCIHLNQPNIFSQVLSFTLNTLFSIERKFLVHVSLDKKKRWHFKIQNIWNSKRTNKSSSDNRKYYHSKASKLTAVVSFENELQKLSSFLPLSNTFFYHSKSLRRITNLLMTSLAHVQKFKGQINWWLCVCRNKLWHTVGLWITIREPQHPDESYHFRWCSARGAPRFPLLFLVRDYTGGKRKTRC